jgi:riboflavin synthase
MFTGIIEGQGTIIEIRPEGQGKRFGLNADFVLDQTKIGDSISVNGVCLTVVKIHDQGFQVDVSPETLARTTFGKAKIGNRVNLERALRLSERIDGHLVSGHIDGMGTIKQKQNKGNAVMVTIGVPESFSRYMIKKGSIAVDGISLTINNCDRNSFDVSIIPHTAKLTTITHCQVGDPVNIEMDMIGKYVERFVTETQSHHKDKENQTGRSIDKQFLAKTGFI